MNGYESGPNGSGGGGAEGGAPTTRYGRMKRARKSPRVSRRLVTPVLAAIILVPAGMGFTNKFLEFLAIYSGEVDGAFAISPIVNYMLAGLGFFFLFLWALFNGMFNDIEGPKFDLLETEAKLDRQDEAEPEFRDSEGLISYV